MLFPTWFLLWWFIQLPLSFLLLAQTPLHMERNERNLMGSISGDDNRNVDLSHNPELGEVLEWRCSYHARRKNNRASLIALDTWKHSSFLCKNYMLNRLENMYNVYGSMKSSKELWKSLKNKYKTEDARSKFIGRKFLDYKIVDSKTIISQVQKL